VKAMEVAAPSEALAGFYGQVPDWSASAQFPGLAHATVDVPLDYTDPAGERISITLGRIPALDPSRRRGVLVVLNGGPGGHNGLGRLSPLRLRGSAVHEVYDLVGFDPRGTGLSSPVMREVTVGKAPWSSRPADEDFAQIAEDMREVYEGSVRAGGNLRRNISTRNVARDLDLIRSALGEEKISLLGYSDGSYMSAVYGTLFGEHVDRHVLDSTVDPGVMWRGQYKAQAVAIRRNVEAWAAWVGERDERFGLGGSAEAVIGSVEAVGAALLAAPLGGVDRTVLDGALGNGATHRPLWAELADTVSALRDGDYRGVQAAWLFAAPDWERPEPGAVLQSGIVEATTSEGDWPSDLEVYFRDMREHRERYPYGYGVMRAQPWVGAFRTEPPREPLTDITRESYGPGLILHAEGNPTLSHTGADAMAELLGDHLITLTDDGSNEIFNVRHHHAADAYVVDYLVNGVLPADQHVTLPGTPRPADTAGSAKGPDADGIKAYLERYRADAKPAA
jgi:pimeloyl-ACP methyl ester carboxylesterase